MADTDSLIATLVHRPVLSFVLSALLVLAGLAALRGIEVRELPAVETPMISVTTPYPGASAEAVDREVTAVIEGAVARVPGLRNISSTSRQGMSRITLDFWPGTALDTAANDVRDAAARVAGNLPDLADPPRTVKADAGGETVMRLSLSSPTRPAEELTRWAEDRLEGRLLSIAGVADVQVNGARAPIFRVDVHQGALAARGLTLADLSRAITAATDDPPAGSLSAPLQTLLVRADRAIETAGDLEAAEIAPDVRLGDVAQVFEGPAPADAIVRTNGVTGIGLSVIRQPQSNSLAISQAVRAVAEDLSRTLPADMRLVVSFDGATYVAGALGEIRVALLLSVMIVTAVMLLFLTDSRLALMPLVAIPVSLVGTVAALWAVGFSLNILTLLAIVLATGLVVDDAIVVTENIARHRALGLRAHDAAVRGTREVFFAVLSTTVTLAATFVPLAFLPGQVGGLFREFGFTLSIAVALSALVALTFCPVIAARILSRDLPQAGPRGPGRAANAYGRAVAACLGAPAPVLTLALVTVVTAALAYPTLRRELVPPEDRGFLPLQIQMPQGVPLDVTADRMARIEESLAPLSATGEIAGVFSFAGAGGPNRGFMGVSLADWAARTRPQAEIAADVTRRLSAVIGPRVSVSQPNSLAIRGAGQGLSLAVTGDDYGALAKVAERLVEALSEDPALGQVRLTFEPTQPQLRLTIDRARAEDLGIDGAGLGIALQALLDGRKAGQIFIGDKARDIRLVSSSEPLNAPDNLARVMVPAGSGQMVPLSAFADLTEEATAPELPREGMRRAVTISAGLTPGIDLGTALARVRAVASPILPEGMGLQPLAEARLFEETGRGVGITFCFALAIVFLVLAAQFESVRSALVVMATVPLGLAFAVLTLALSGMSLNLYSQIGLVLIVGIMAKNGILIVEFANQLRAAGRPVRQAVIEAATVRFRPVLMTMLSTVLGALPLALAHGPGAEARVALGVLILGGLGPAALVTLFLTPVAYGLLIRGRRPD